MGSAPRHQCLIYDGAPSRLLPALAAAAHQKLQQNYRCLCLNTVPMIAGMRSYLAATGVDVAHEMAKASLVLSSERRHLIDGRFHVEHMMQSLEDALAQALSDGYAGLWATGDMAWELGPDRDFSRLLEYEWRLEEFFHGHPQLSGICQYHADAMPRDAVRHGLLAHPTLFINETLQILNPHYVHAHAYTPTAEQNPALDSMIESLCLSQRGALASAPFPPEPCG